MQTNEHTQTMIKNTTKFIAGCAILASATGIFASETHAGDHPHSHGHGAANIGIAGLPGEVSRTIQVDMKDTMRFTPASIQVKQGETIRFLVKNSGQLSHEFVLGSPKDLAAHYEVMKKNPEMEHADDNMRTVAPGQSAEMLWKFTHSGSIGFACLHVGHYEAGMKGTIAVARSAGKPAAGKAVNPKPASINP